MSISFPLTDVIVDQQNAEEPKWLSVSSFEAKTTALDKVNRVINNLSFATCFFGIFALATRASGYLVFGSCLSAIITGRKVMGAVSGYAVCPVAFASFFPWERAKLEKKGQEEILKLNPDFFVKRVSLCKSGTKYDGYLIAHHQWANNGRWTLNALGNVGTIEYSLFGLATENAANQCNTLLINAPSVGKSGGWPTRYQMGAGLEAGLQYLETVVKAQHIIMRGFSLGSGMWSEGILQHDFNEGLKKNIRYLAISEVSFCSLSNVAKAYAGKIAPLFFYLAGMELDGIAGARKLSRLDIKQIVIQHSSLDGTGSDGVIPDNASLATALRNDPFMTNKVYIESTTIHHNRYPPPIEEQLKNEITRFLSSPHKQEQS